MKKLYLILLFVHIISSGLSAQGNIPTVIALSPETLDKAIATAIESPQIETLEVKGQKIYTLSGVEVKSTDQKGIYIINGKKVLVK